MENSVEGLENKLRFPRGGESQKGKKGEKRLVREVVYEILYQIIGVSEKDNEINRRKKIAKI